MTERVGVVVMAHGTPATPDDVEAFYTHIRRGRPPSPEQLADLAARYRAIGGTSPLAARTRAQADAIAAALEADHPGRFTVALGAKHAPPFIEDAVAELADAGVVRTVGLVLAPHFSAASVGQYQERAAAAAAQRGLSHLAIEHWHLLPAWVAFLARVVAEGRAGLPPRHKVLFSAHSLPLRALAGDPYPEQLRAGAAAVAEAVGMLPWPDWATAWQSAPRPSGGEREARPSGGEREAQPREPWAGPDLGQVLVDLAGTGRADGVLVCPHGFTADHLEVLYDLDVVAAGVAADAGLAFARTPVANDDPAVMAALAGLVAARAGA